MTTGEDEMFDGSVEAAPDERQRYEDMRALAMTLVDRAVAAYALLPEDAPTYDARLVRIELKSAADKMLASLGAPPILESTKDVETATWIFVNAKVMRVRMGVTCYEALVMLAIGRLPERGELWTVTVYWGKNNGCELLPGQTVAVRDNMRVNVAYTGNA